jgi:calcineurin-like phosphoesterase family protein
MTRKKNYWFSADWHLHHANVIKYDGRPFTSVEQMNEAILSNWEKVVHKGDEFFYLGDFCLGSTHKAEELLYRMSLHGADMFFIRGNHDKKDMVALYKKYGTYLGEQMKVKIYDQEIVLNHYQMVVWDKSHHGSWHLHGHSHHSLPIRKEARCIDVGINGESYDYKPLDFEQIQKIMATKVWKPIDHHTSETK